MESPTHAKALAEDVSAWFLTSKYCAQSEALIHAPFHYKEIYEGYEALQIQYKPIKRIVSDITTMYPACAGLDGDAYTRKGARRRCISLVSDLEILHPKLSSHPRTISLQANK